MTAAALFIISDVGMSLHLGSAMRNLALFAADPVWPLFLCAVLTAALIAYTFYVPEAVEGGAEKTRLSYLKERKDQVYENLRDLNFEYRSGKFPESDYQQMRATLENEAAALLREIEQLEAAQINPLYRDLPGALRNPNSKGARS